MNTFPRRSTFAHLNDGAVWLELGLLLCGLLYVLPLCFEFTDDVPVVFDVDLVALQCYQRSPCRS